MKYLMIYIAAGCMLFVDFQAQNHVLDAYITEGLQSNQSLKQKQLDYSKSLYALKEARGFFFTDVQINARYTVAQGGRTIDFPVGDLLNDVYRTLNILTQSESFPQIDNEEFNFYRPREHETKVSLVQPIFSSDVIGNYRISKAYTELVRVDINQYKRALVKEIQTAYYDYLKSYELLNLADTTMKLVKENLRVSRSLFENDLVTIDVVYRSEAEVSKVNVERAKAESLMRSAKSYFNFLLNRPLEIDVERFSEQPELPLYSLESAQDEAVAKREEIDLLRRREVLNDRELSLYKGKAFPDLIGMVDYGFQGEEYTFEEDEDFVLASMVLRWHIFQGFSNRNKIRQVRIENEIIENRIGEAESQIKLQVLQSYYRLLAANESVESEKKHVRATRLAFSFMQKKYAEGQATLLEYIDARTAYTNAESSLIIAKYDFFQKKSEMEHVSASLDVTKYAE